MDIEVKTLLKDIHEWMTQLSSEDGHDYASGWIELLPRVEQILGESK